MRSCEKFHREAAHGGRDCPVCNPLFFVRQRYTRGFFVDAYSEAREASIRRLAKAWKKSHKHGWEHTLNNAFSR